MDARLRQLERQIRADPDNDSAIIEYSTAASRANHSIQNWTLPALAWSLFEQYPPKSKAVIDSMGPFLRVLEPFCAKYLEPDSDATLPQTLHFAADLARLGLFSLELRVMTCLALLLARDSSEQGDEFEHLGRMFVRDPALWDRVGPKLHQWCLDARYLECRKLLIAGTLVPLFKARPRTRVAVYELCQAILGDDKQGSDQAWGRDLVAKLHSSLFCKARRLRGETMFRALLPACMDTVTSVRENSALGMWSLLRNRCLGPALLHEALEVYLQNMTDSSERARRGRRSVLAVLIVQLIDWEGADFLGQVLERPKDAESLVALQLLRNFVENRLPNVLTHLHPKVLQCIRQAHEYGGSVKLRVRIAQLLVEA